uniref:Uncharacterized protein n=1 Tax=Arundo donax TaxID=35708 RepID=A0A0A9D8M3_ARUDO
MVLRCTDLCYKQAKTILLPVGPIGHASRCRKAILLAYSLLTHPVPTCKISHITT